MEFLVLINEIVIPPIIIPLVMIVFGAIFMENAPGEINHLYGYRSEMSMKNRDTWEFAHKFSGRLWFIFGLILLPVSVIALYLIQKRLGFGTALLIVLGVQLIPLAGSIILTEIALRIKFDENGEWREK